MDRTKWREARRLVFALAFILPWQCLGQGGSGSIDGTVIDPAGAPASGALVRLFLPNGSHPILETRTQNGRFLFPQVRPAFYDIVVEASGFQRLSLRGIKVDPDRPAVVKPQRLSTGSATGLTEAGTAEGRGLPAPIAAAVAVEASYPSGLGSSAEILDFSAEQRQESAAGAEAAFSVTEEQVRALPALDRDPMRLILTQPGIVAAETASGRSATVVNGMRASFANLTLDGVNIQRNYVRGDALESQSNRLFLDQVSEFSAITSNAGAQHGGGAAQVIMVTPSGSNLFHGSGYWAHRNQALAANGFENNRRGIGRGVFNQNQAGFTLHGPLRKDRLFFYANYEWYLRRSEIALSRTVPSDAARDGLFTYQAGGVTRQVNVLGLTQTRIHPEIQKMLDLIPRGLPRVSHFAADGLNSFGGLLSQRNDWERRHASGKLDWNVSPVHALSGTFLWADEDQDRPLESNNYGRLPAYFAHNIRRVSTGAWRWNPTNRITNEIRGGFNSAPGDFFVRNDADLPDVRPSLSATALTPRLFDPVVNGMLGQTRTDETVTLQDGATYVSGKHQVHAGWQYQRFSSRFRDDASILPVHILGAAQAPFTRADFPGIDTAGFVRAVNFWGALTGKVVRTVQRFHATDGKGFAAGVPLTGSLSFSQNSWYAQDQWRIHPNLTLTGGVRYELPGVPGTTDKRLLSPQLAGGNPLRALMSDSTLALQTGPWYAQDRNDFAPNVALAWDVFGSRRWIFRAGYSLHYVNDEHVRSAEAALEINPGLRRDIVKTWNPVEDLSAVPAVSPPALRIPSRLSEAGTSLAAIGVIDPGLRTPYVQQWTASVQHEVAGLVMNARYLGNRALKGFMRLNMNQIDVRAAGFLDDFRRAQRNLELSGRLNPPEGCMGCQPLQVIPRLADIGIYSQAAIQYLVGRGDVANLADYYQISGNELFYPNRLAGEAYLTSNFAESTYHALQLDASRRFRSGLQFQANYVVGKVLGSGGETSDLDSARTEPRVDSFNSPLARARAPFDLRHVLKASGLYALPLARWYAGGGPWFRTLLRGWVASGIMMVNSGPPYSVLSGRATFNRWPYSISNPANSNLSGEQLVEAMRFGVDGAGPHVGPRNGATQFYLHPPAGTIGMLQPRMFSSPWAANFDAAVLKSTRIHETHSVELRVEIQNLLNQTNWVVGNQNLDDPNYSIAVFPRGRPREIQLGLVYRF